MACVVGKTLKSSYRFCLSIYPAAEGVILIRLRSGLHRICGTVTTCFRSRQTLNLSGNHAMREFKLRSSYFPFRCRWSVFCACARARVCVCVYVLCVCMCLCARKHARVCVCMCVCVRVMRDVYVCVCVHARMSLSRFVCACLCVYVCVCVCVCV